ncbi:MAG: hypothetical protein K2W82_11475 [Candidatus Obscuribacterales bacterium]|nr:hypothetical protein [Candidatus Obscuribacterales bacterium]
MSTNESLNSQNKNQAFNENVFQAKNASCFLGFYVPGNSMLLKGDRSAPQVVAYSVADIFTRDKKDVRR